MRRSRSHEDYSAAEENPAHGRVPFTCRLSKRRRVSITEAFRSLGMNSSGVPRESEISQSFLREDSVGECEEADSEESSADSSGIEILSDQQIAQRKIMYSLLATAVKNNTTQRRKDVVDERLETMIRETRKQAERRTPRRLDDWRLTVRMEPTSDAAYERRSRSNSLPYHLESRGDRRTNDAGMDLT